MRALALALGCTTLITGVARAETAAELEAKGKALAEQRRYSEAIDAFKAADKQQPTASHACLIALAYTRRELWPQAEVFLAKCHARATAADPLPEWVPLADKQLAERLAAVNVAAVTITVEPASAANVRLTASSFAPDETFEPRTIHLPPGSHSITATADGFSAARQDIEIVDNAPKQVVIHLEAPVPMPATPIAPHPITGRAQPSASKVPWIVLGIGGALVVAGGVVHVTKFRTARNDLAQYADGAPMADPVRYAEAEPAFDKWRNVTIGVYTAGVVTVATGVILKLALRRPEAAPAVAFTPADGGGMVSVGWSR